MESLTSSGLDIWNIVLMVLVGAMGLFLPRWVRWSFCWD